jgi:hypothetical protein
VTQRKCSKCYGSGRVGPYGSPAEMLVPCEACAGTGWVEYRPPAKRRGGAPGSLTEAQVLVMGPRELLDAARAAAAAEGIPEREWWRRAARARLDRLEVERRLRRAWRRPQRPRAGQGGGSRSWSGRALPPKL